MKKIPRLTIFFAIIFALFLMVITIPKISVNAIEGKFWAENEDVEQSEEIIYTGDIEGKTFYIKFVDGLALVSNNKEEWKEIAYRRNGNSLYLQIENEEALLVLNDNKTFTYTGYITTIDEPNETNESEEITKQDIEEIIDKALQDAGLNADDINNLKEMYATITSPDLTLEQKLLYIMVVVLAALGVSMATLVIYKKSLQNLNAKNNKQVATLIDSATKLIDKADESIKAANLTQEQVNAQGETINKFIDKMADRDEKIEQLLALDETQPIGYHTEDEVVEEKIPEEVEQAPTEEGDTDEESIE